MKVRDWNSSYVAMFGRTKDEQCEGSTAVRFLLSLLELCFVPPRTISDLYPQRGSRKSTWTPHAPAPPLATRWTPSAAVKVPEPDPTFVPCVLEEVDRVERLLGSPVNGSFPFLPCLLESLMVQLMSYGKLRPESELPIKKLPSSVKVETEDQLEDEHGPPDKRFKIAPPPQQWETGESMPPTEAIQHNLLSEPSPLGLRLRKSPSLLHLIQMRLAQANAAVSSGIMKNESLEDEKKKDTRSTCALANTEKIKASNFPASLLRIGTWEVSQLLAKCYFAKRKLVWEILEGGLKSKIEIQWSDITTLRATCPENGPETLNIVLARQPLFFRETNPQPRKHTLWQATSDFTNGQASMHR
ncbi:hypothetical protein B296_00001801 [Ensete ventricosum]|uniref:TRF2/HOY1 PH-like domain-containing protein n=1 Tax=Ensete ventricosum TaxID=4639 RepID=A0A427AQF6_ENSVE|nr:hypothetical protein B296_00001801 [Ensete ventricosum]